MPVSVPGTLEEPSSITRLRGVSRVGALATLLVILSSNLFGRMLLNRFGILNDLAVYIEAAVLLTLLWYCARFVARFPKVEPGVDRCDRAELVSAFACLLLLLLYSETLVSVSVERVHFAKYGVLAFFIYFSDFLPVRFRTIPGAIITAGLLGAGDESLQAIIPQRFFDIRDLFLDLNGAIFGGALAWITVLCRPDLRKVSY